MCDRIIKVTNKKTYTLEIDKNAVTPELNTELFEMIIKWCRDKGCEDKIQFYQHSTRPNDLFVSVEGGEWIEHKDRYVLYLTIKKESLKLENANEDLIQI